MKSPSSTVSGVWFNVFQCEQSSHLTASYKSMINDHYQSNLYTFTHEKQQWSLNYYPLSWRHGLWCSKGKWYLYCCWEWHRQCVMLKYSSRLPQTERAGCLIFVLLLQEPLLCPGGILVRCLNNSNWLLWVWRSSISTLSLSRMTKCLALSLEEDMGVYGPWVKWKFMKRSNKTKPSQGANQINWLEGLTALRFCCCFTTPVEPPIQWLFSPAEWF